VYLGAGLGRGGAARTGCASREGAHADSIVATAAIALGAVSLLEAVGAGPFPSDLTRPASLTGNATLD
jgi:hypothetical protein